MYRAVLWISQLPQRHFQGWKVFLTMNIKRLLRMISKSIIFDCPEIFFDTVRQQIRSFVCLFPSYACKMEIQKMVPPENVDWFISHSFCQYISLRWVRLFCLVGFFNRWNDVAINEYTCSYLIQKSNENLHLMQIKFCASLCINGWPIHPWTVAVHHVVYYYKSPSVSFSINILNYEAQHFRPLMHISCQN